MANIDRATNAERDAGNGKYQRKLPTTVHGTTSTLHRRAADKLAKFEGLRPELVRQELFALQ